MAKYITKFLSLSTGSANSGGVSGPWVDISDIVDPVFQACARATAGSANGSTPSATVAVYGTYDDAHLNGSVVGRFRVASYAITTAADMSAMVTSAYQTGPTGRELPLRYARLQVETLSQGTPSIMVYGKVRGLSDEG